MTTKDALSEQRAREVLAGIVPGGLQPPHHAVDDDFAHIRPSEAIAAMLAFAPPVIPATVDREAQIEAAAIYVLENSRRSNASMNDYQRAADTDALMKAYRDIIGKALDSGALTTSANEPAKAGEDSGWIVTNGKNEGEQFRTWESGMPEWAADRDRATRYARREDAEAVHREDEDAWHIVPYALANPVELPGAEDVAPLMAVRQIVADRSLLSDDQLAARILALIPRASDEVLTAATIPEGMGESGKLLSAPPEVPMSEEERQAEIAQCVEKLKEAFAEQNKPIPPATIPGGDREALTRIAEQHAIETLISQTEHHDIWGTIALRSGSEVSINSRHIIPAMLRFHEERSIIDASLAFAPSNQEQSS